jgi:hypothetical protein
VDLPARKARDLGGWKERKQKKKEKEHRTKRQHWTKRNPTADTLFVHGMPWHAYAVAVKANGKGHRSLSYNTVMSTRVGISL